MEDVGKGNKDDDRPTEVPSPKDNGDPLKEENRKKIMKGVFTHFISQQNGPSLLNVANGTLILIKKTITRVYNISQRQLPT